MGRPTLSAVGYPRRLLGDDEDIAMEFRPHWWYFARQAAAGVVVVVVLAAVLRLEGDAQTVALWVFAALSIAWALWLLVALARWSNTHFVVTTHRLVFRSGVLARHGREIPLERVNDITFHQSLWERVVGAGDLMVESAGEHGQQRFTDIPHPESVQQEIYHQVDAGRRVGGAGAAPGRMPTIPEQIEQLADLRDRGIVTDDEFQRKKRELLDRM